MTCGICEELSGIPPKDCGDEYAQLVHSGTNVLHSTEHHVLLPSVGPLASTHVMVVPQTHFNSFFEAPQEIVEDGLALIEKIRDFSRTHLGTELLFFESGAGKYVNASGGCIYHSHVHLLPYAEAFDRRLKTEIPLQEMDLQSLREEADIQTGYVWYSPMPGTQFLCNRPLLPSQFLRYLYADSTGLSVQWNWRRHPNIAGVANVVERFRSLACLKD